MSKVNKEANVWYILDGRGNTVGDLREFVNHLDVLGVPDSYALEDCIVAFRYGGEFELILDGEFAPYENKYDVLIPMKFNKENEKD